MPRFAERTLFGEGPLGGVVSHWNYASLIQSVQSGTIALTAGNNTVASTITAVNRDNSLLMPLHYTSSSNTNPARNSMPRLIFTNGTTITASHQFQDAAGGTSTVGFMVFEFIPGVLHSNQFGTIDLNNVTSNTATITSVVPGKSLLIPLGAEQNANALQETTSQAKVALTNSTTITATVNTSGAVSFIVGFQLAEFF